MSLVKSLSVSALVLISSAALTACEIGAPPSMVEGVVVQRIDLSAALGLDSVQVTGVTVDPISGTRFVLDAAAGIYSIDEAGQSELVLAMADFPEADVPLRSGFLDIAAMGNGRFALVAVGDGYLLDIEEGTLSQWFCYEPGWMDPEEFEQESNNLAYDIASDQILSAPLTMETGNLDADTVTRSDVATFDGAGAGDLSWFPLQNGDRQFGGLALASDGTLLLGAGSTLFRYTMGDSELEVLGSLEAHGVDVIDGLVLEPGSGHLMVVDGLDHELVILDL